MSAIRIVVLVGLGLAVPAGIASAQQKPPKKADVAAAAATLVGTDLAAAARAAETLGKSPAPAAHDVLLDALAFGLPAAVAVPAFTALGAHPAPPDASAIRRYAKHRNAQVRGAALVALASYPEPGARAAIVAGLRDQATTVRASAAAAAAKGRVRDAVEPLLQLLGKGEEAAAHALAELADPDLARKIADHYGKVPDAALALCLGLVLRKKEFGPDTARVEVVRAMAKIQDPSALKQLAEYVDATPKNPPRTSRQEAEMVINARAGGAR